MGILTLSPRIQLIHSIFFACFRQLGAFSSVFGSSRRFAPVVKAEHAVTPVPVQPSGTLFYRAKQFYKRNLWAFIYEWDKNMFRYKNSFLIYGNHLEFVLPCLRWVMSIKVKCTVQLLFFHSCIGISVLKRRTNSFLVSDLW